MNSMSQDPTNMTRVMLVSNEGVTISFAFFKDGMYQEDNSNKWNRPSEYEGWLSIKEVKFKLGLY